MMTATSQSEPPLTLPCDAVSIYVRHHREDVFLLLECAITHEVDCEKMGFRKTALAVRRLSQTLRRVLRAWGER